MSFIKNINRQIKDKKEQKLFLQNLIQENRCRNSKNEITSNLKEISTIDLSGMGLTKIPKIDILKNQLENLDLSNNKIKDIENLNQLTLLKTLNLSHNQLSHLHYTYINELKNLEKLDLSHNLFVHIEGFMKGNNIKELNLSHNLLSEISYNITIFDNLEKLDLSHNIISEIKNLFNKKTEIRKGFITDITTEHTTLKYINLSNNNINTIQNLYKIKNLEEMNLSNNPLYFSKYSEQDYKNDYIKKLILDDKDKTNIQKYNENFINLKNSYHSTVKLNDSIKNEFIMKMKKLEKLEEEIEEKSKQINQKIEEKETNMGLKSDIENYEFNLS